MRTGFLPRTLRRALSLLLCGLLAVMLAVNGGTAQEQEELKPPEAWQLNGIMAALDDPDPEVWVEALANLSGRHSRRGVTLYKYEGYKLDHLTPPLTLAGATYDPKAKLKKIAGWLQDEDLAVRWAAAWALGEMKATDQIPEILPLLQDEDSDVQQLAARALGWMKATDQSAQILPLLEDEDSDVRRAAARALGWMKATDQIPKILPLLQDEGWDVQQAAARALGGMKATDQIPKILPLLEDEDSGVRRAAAWALGGMKATDQIPKILPLLEDEDSQVQQVAVEALGEMGQSSAPYAAQIALLLKDKDSYVQGNAFEALLEIGHLDDDAAILAILNAIYGNSIAAPKLRFLAYFLSGGREDVVLLLQWLGLPKETPLDRNPNLSHKDGKRTLDVFEQNWQQVKSLDALHRDLERKISMVVNKTSWTSGDIPLLRKHYQNLQAIDSRLAADVGAKIAALEGIRWLTIAFTLWLVHVILWSLLLWFYPTVPQLQALFWNPKLRCILSWGYLDFLLAWSPQLRSRPLLPFRRLLVADAGLDSFDAQAYFPNSHIALKGASPTQPLSAAMPQLNSPVVLEGESGLGKSMFLRHLAQVSRQPIVYLPAAKCAQGVIPAIQAKLPLADQDPRFLRTLIANNALDICIDGLNEVTPDTRAQINTFVERHAKGRIIMATQPLDWMPPTTSKTLILQPLKRQQIEQFLLSRQAILPDDAAVLGVQYQEACEDYLADALSPQQSDEERKALRRSLSNPMDLTIVAQLLAQGKTPNLLNLQQQQYEVMAAEYERLHFSPFPLERFAQMTYQMRLDDAIAIPAKEWEVELLSCLERYKMVLRRQTRDTRGVLHTEWYFRHDKIQEYFIVQTFLGEENEKPLQHVHDPRFRGVYLLLATLLPFDRAIQLRELLIQKAVETKDHLVSDRFIEQFNSRTELASSEFKDEKIAFYQQQAQELMRAFTLVAGKSISLENIFMSDSYKSKYDQRQSQIGGNIDTAQSGSQQKFAQQGTQHNYAPEERQSLAEAAAEIQQLLQQLEQSNPTTTTAEQMQLAARAIEQIESNPTLKQRAISAARAGAIEALKQNPIGAIIAAAIEGWAKTEAS